VVNTNQTFEQLLIDVNKSIIKMRGAYAIWCKKRGINYHELLIWYSLRDFGSCTQKQVCEQYLLPKQTIHNIVTELQEKGLIQLRSSPDNWREKMIVLTDLGQAYYDSIMAPPVTLAQLIQALYNIVDSYFVGRYSEDGLTALSIVFPIQLVITAIAVGTGDGVNTKMPWYYARRAGKGRPH